MHPVLGDVFNPRGDGHCGFRCISYIVSGGDDSQYVDMRRRLMEHVTMNWYELYSNVYSTDLNGVIHRLGWLWETPCDETWWFWNVDLLGYATMFNWTFVVFGPGLRGVPYGETYLPLIVEEGTTAPLGVSYIVCTGNHWVVLTLNDAIPVLPIPAKSMYWRYWAQDRAKQMWEHDLYRDEHVEYERLSQ